MVLTQIDIARDIYVQLGALGILLLVLLTAMWFTLKYNMSQMKEDAKLIRQQVADLRDENKILSESFRDYLIMTTKDLLTIIGKSDNTTNRFLDFLEQKFGKYMEVRTVANDKLYDSLREFIETQRNINKRQ